MRKTVLVLASLVLAGVLCACSAGQGGASSSSSQAPADRTTVMEVSDRAASPSDMAPASRQAGSASAAASGPSSQASQASQASSGSAASSSAASTSAAAATLRAALDLAEDYRDGFVHGEKGAAFQKYIVMHDTEGDGDAAGVVDYWDGSGNGVAAHFVVNKDGSIVQCVPLDKIAHHAGFGDTGHNEQYGVEDESRDDRVGTVPIGDWAADYGMNSWSIGIEMVHVGGSGYYPEEQLAAVDALIAYIDAYYGFESQIIDHKAWRSGNSDTSPEFAPYLANLQDHRTCNAG